MKSSALLYCILLLISCQRELTPTPGPVILTAQTKLNVSYGPSALQQMDIYLPAGRHKDSTKVLFMIHGGGWSQEDKSGLTPYVDTLKKRLGPHYAVVNLNYRLATAVANQFPTQENDIKAAIEFIYSKRSEYNISEKFVLLGVSAGSHLALLQAYKYTSPVRIKAVVDFFGPTDLVDLYNNPPNPLAPILLQQVTGGTPTTQPAIYQQSSPLNFATAQSPPTIILHGGVDGTVPPSQSVSLNNKLQALGVAHQYVFYPTENHGWFGANLVDSFDKIVAFLNVHVN